MTFETQYQLDEFREVKGEYFDEDNKIWDGLNCSPVSTMMTRMLNLIDQLTIEVTGLEYELKELTEAYKDACDAAGAQEQRAREAESEIRQILNDIER